MYNVKYRLDMSPCITGIPFFIADQGHSCRNPRSGFKILTLFRGGGRVNICWIDSNPVCYSDVMTINCCAL